MHLVLSYYCLNKEKHSGIIGKLIWSDSCKHLCEGHWRVLEVLKCAHKQICFRYDVGAAVMHSFLLLLCQHVISSSHVAISGLGADLGKVMEGPSGLTKSLTSNVLR